MGVCNHSTDAITNEYVIFAIDEGALALNQFVNLCISLDVRYHVLLGSYKGATEVSFLTNAENLPKLMPLLRNQESILHLGPLYRDNRLWGSRQAELLYYNEHQGAFVSVYKPKERFIVCTEAEAKANGSYTYEPVLNRYWIMKPYKAA